MRQEWPPGSGVSHPLWILDSPARLRAQADVARDILRGPLRHLTAGSSGAASAGSYTPVSQLSRLCGRNLRAAFQRYCAKWNKASGVVWCGVEWSGVVWCGVVWCGVVWGGVVWCGVVWGGVVWRGVVWCGVVWCGVVWCGVVWCGMAWRCMA
jgi:hypothetical protein